MDMQETIRLAISGKICLGDQGCFLALVKLPLDTGESGHAHLYMTAFKTLISL